MVRHGHRYGDRQRHQLRRRLGRTALSSLVVALLSLVVLTQGAQASSDGYRTVQGSGSTWSATILSQWISNVKQNQGIPVTYEQIGSTGGRQAFSAGTVDFALSEIPYGLDDANGTSDPPPARPFAYIPVVAGGTAIMYNLRIAGQQVTNLRLSGATLSRIFTGQITKWNDPAILEDNPNLALPDRQIIPVVRSDGSGTSAQFTAWMARQHPDIWTAYCRERGFNVSGNCPLTSFYPTPSGGISQAQSLGVSGYVQDNDSTITYVEYSYARGAQFPVAKILNAAGYYSEPTAENVAVSLTAAQIETENQDPRYYLTQKLEGVYNFDDARTYPLSSYSYMVIPTAATGQFNAEKGRTLRTFLAYALCTGQQEADPLGYSPLPINLVQAGFDQVQKIPVPAGTDPADIEISRCGNPTFSADGRNTLAETAPQPPACDRQGTSQCSQGTGGARASTPVTRGTGPAGEVGASPDAGGGGGDAAGEGGGGAAAGGAGGGAAGTAGAGGAGASAATGEAGVPGAEVPGAAAGTASGETFVDPETGEIIAADGAGAGAAAGGGTTFVSGVPVSAPGGSGWQIQHTLMVLSALALLIATVGPPLLTRRLRAQGGPR